MRINLQDSSFIVSYIQMFLKEYSGINIKKVVSVKSKGVYTNDSYIVSMNSPLRVTGIYDIETYQAAALYMAFNYPNEQFPTIWNLNSDTDTWDSIPYEPDKFVRTMDLLIKECHKVTVIDGKQEKAVTDRVLAEYRTESQPEDILIYTELITDYDFYLTWSELLRYFSSEGMASYLYEELTNKCSDYISQPVPDSGAYTKEDLNKRLVNIIVSNSNIAASHKEVVELDERILSYFFGEVVSPISSKEEVYRIQKMMYDNIPLSRIGKFDDKMSYDVRVYQQDFLTGFQGVQLPDVYTGFKVTGYVDPWTEKIIRERGVS